MNRTTISFKKGLKKNRLLLRILGIVLIICVIHQSRNFKITSSKPPSKWSYHSSDVPCEKEVAFDREFLGYTSQVLRFWEMFLEDDVTRVKAEIKEFVKAIPSPPQVNGRGIVFSANPGALRMVSISIKFLRSYGCNLPIEIWHLNELNEKQIAQIEMIDGVTVRNTGHYNLKTLHIPAKSRLYAMKGAALLFSSFDEILFLDCDNIPARDPSFLFETEAFIETGALFWKDFWMTKPNNPIYPILDLKCVKEQEFESGQMVIKKSFPGVFNALSLAFYMQRNSELYFKFFHGDKDSFRFAWRYFDVPYHQVRPFPGVAGPALMGGGVCGVTMVQFSPNWVSHEYGSLSDSVEDEPLEVLFFHMNSSKDTKRFELDMVGFYKNEISTDGIARFFGIPGKTCIGLAETGLKFEHKVQFRKIDESFRIKYEAYFKEWQYSP